MTRLYTFTEACSGFSCLAPLGERDRVRGFTFRNLPKLHPTLAAENHSAGSSPHKNLRGHILSTFGDILLSFGALHPLSWTRKSIKHKHPTLEVPTSKQSPHTAWGAPWCHFQITRPDGTVSDSFPSRQLSVCRNGSATFYSFREP